MNDDCATLHLQTREDGIFVTIEVSKSSQPHLQQLVKIGENKTVTLKSESGLITKIKIAPKKPDPFRDAYFDSSKMQEKPGCLAWCCFLIILLILSYFVKTMFGS